MSKDSRFHSPVRSQQLVRMPNHSETASKHMRTPTVSIQPGINNFSNEQTLIMPKKNIHGTSTPSPSTNYRSSTPLSPFLKPTPVPENIVQRAGDAAIVTAQYLQAVNSTSLNKHYKDFFKHCGASSASVKAKYLANLKNQLRIDPKLVYARSTLSRSADEFGWTGLHFAAKENNVDMIEVLLNCKADPMSIDVRGCTALHIAAKSHRLEACKRLIEAFQDANDGIKPVGQNAPVDLRGFTPAIYAKITKASKDRNIDKSLEDAERRKAACQELLYEFGDRHISPRNPSPASLRKGGHNYDDLPTLKNSLTYTHQWMKGWRENFEDAFIADVGDSSNDLCIFGIFDGHLGSFTSQFCAENFQKVFDKVTYLELQKRNLSVAKELYENIDCMSEILKATFVELDTQLRNNPMLSGKIHDNDDTSTAGLHEKDRNGFQENAALGEGQARAPDQSGSTAVVVLVTPQYIITGNVGDSRAVLRTCSERGQTIALNRDHNYQLPDEVERVKKAGGMFNLTRLLRSAKEGEKRHLSMTRSIGDFYYKDQKDKDMLSQVVLPLPEISVYKRCKEDALLLVACDGIWDVMDNSDACEKVLETKEDLDEGVFQLMVECMQLGSTDNMSAIAVLFDHKSQAHLPTYLKHHGAYFQCDWDKTGQKIYTPYEKTSKIFEQKEAENVVDLSNLVLRKTEVPSEAPESSPSNDPKFFSVSDELSKKLGVQRSKIVDETNVALSAKEATSVADSKKIVDECSGASTELAQKLSKRLNSMKSIKRKPLLWTSDRRML